MKSKANNEDVLILPSVVTSDAYRRMVQSTDLITRKVQVRETDLLVSGFNDLEKMAKALVQKYRQQIENYIEKHPSFVRAMLPLKRDPFAPRIINSMIEAASRAHVGPMASVAGAISEYVGLGLLPYSRDVIVENGGDVFISSSVKRKVMLLAESSGVSGIKIAIQGSPKPIGLCTSSGKLGHSLSYGRADGVMALGPTASLADAAATGIANCVKTPSDIKEGLKMAQNMGMIGIIILVDGYVGAWGEIEFLN